MLFALEPSHAASLRNPESNPAWIGSEIRIRRLVPRTRRLVPRAGQAVLLRETQTTLQFRELGSTDRKRHPVAQLDRVTMVAQKVEFFDER